MREENLRRYVAHHPTGMKVLYAVLGLFMIASIGYYAFFYYQKSVESSVSQEIHEVQKNYDLLLKTLSEKSQENAISEGVEINYEEEAREIARYGEQFYNIYAGKKSSENGIRALFHAATALRNSDILLNKLALRNEATTVATPQGVNETVIGYLETVEADEHYLSPQAIFLQAQMYEDALNYTQSLEKLELLASRYPDSFLKGEVALMQTRIFLVNEDYFQAYATIQQGLEDEKLKSYHETLRTESAYLNALGFAPQGGERVIGPSAGVLEEAGETSEEQ